MRSFAIAAGGIRPALSFGGVTAVKKFPVAQLSRPPEPSFNNQTPNEAPKGKTDGGGPRPKKNQKSKKKKKEKRREGF